MSTHWPAAAVIVLCSLHAGVQAQERTRIGRAVDAGSGALVYEERHSETVAGGEVVADEVRYVDPQGRTFATKRVDFRSHPFTPDFALSSETTGQLEVLQRDGAGVLTVRCREQAGAALRDARLTAPADALADAGFDRFIESQWRALLAGERPVRRFLIPCRLEFMGFRFRRIDDGGDPARVRFAMEIDSPLLRLLAPSVTVDYDRASRRLLRYEGPSNLRDRNGDNHRVRIDFRYPANVAQAP